MFTRHLSQWYPINFNRLQGHIYEKLEKSFARNTAPPELKVPRLTFPGDPKAEAEALSAVQEIETLGSPVGTARVV